jgi:hypothetical protein
VAAPVKTIDVLLFDGESNVPCVRKSEYDAIEARIANGLKLFEDFYWPPPEDAPEEAQRIRDIIAALKGATPI